MLIHWLNIPGLRGSLSEYQAESERGLMDYSQSRLNEMGRSIKRHTRRGEYFRSRVDLDLLVGCSESVIMEGRPYLHSGPIGLDKVNIL